MSILFSRYQILSLFYCFDLICKVTVLHQYWWCYFLLHIFCGSRQDHSNVAQQLHSWWILKKKPLGTIVNHSHHQWLYFVSLGQKTPITSQKKKCCWEKTIIDGDLINSFGPVSPMNPLLYDGKTTDLENHSYLEESLDVGWTTRCDLSSTSV